MSPTVKTLLMSIITAAMAMLAAYFYPWPETIVQSEIVGKPLFKDFASEKAKKLMITRYDQQSGQLKSIEVQLSSTGWVLPDYRNYPVTNANQNGVAVNAFEDCTVLLEEVDDLERHGDYGVVDPTQYKTVADKSTLGAKVTVFGGTGGELASMIVGKTVKDSRPDEFGAIQHYVTLPGKSPVYVVDINPRAFPADFDRWVNPNLLSIPFNAQKLNAVITNVEYPPENFENKQPQLIYRIRLKGNATVPNRNLNTELASGKLSVAQFELGNDSNQFVQATPPEIDPKTWSEFNLMLRRIRFSSVKRKNKEVTEAFSNPDPAKGSKPFGGLESVGFKFKNYANGMPQFDCSTGHVSFEFQNGARLQMLLGTIALETTTDQNELNRHVMFTGEFDDTLLPTLPPKPADDASEDDKKAYLRAEKDRNRIADECKEFIELFNDQHASWVYLVPETVCDRFVPEIDITQASGKDKASEDSDNPATAEAKQDPTPSAPADDDTSKKD